MAQNNRLDTTIRIPVVTDLVRPGDPEIIRRTRERSSGKARSAFEHTLKARIEDLKSATGQDEYGKLARAHAIRSESNHHKPQTVVHSKEQDIGPELEMDTTVLMEEEELDLDSYLPDDLERFSVIRKHK